MKIKFVDGFEIRNTIDTNFCGHFTSDYAPYIPKDEIWLEDYLKPEKGLFLHIVRTEKKFFKQDKPFSFIRHFLVEEARKNKPRPNFKKRTVKKGKLKVVYVDGRIIRKYIDPYFVSGGHGIIYRYIPKNEVWIDLRNYLEDQPFVVAHEVYERKLMSQGMGYYDAHDFATAEERRLRRKHGVAKFING